MTRPEKRRRIDLPPPAPAAAATIPDDLLISEVLVRLPVASLLRVKSVCRSWRAAVEDPAFVRRHLDHSRATSRPPTLLVVPRADGDPDDDDEASESEAVSFHRLLLDEAGTADVALMFEKALVPEEEEGRVSMTNAVVPTHCDGLVALATATGHVFVCNPATREFVVLPPGDNSSAPAAAAALGYDAWRGRYVVTRCFYRRRLYAAECKEEDAADVVDYDDIGHEVFTLGDDDDAWVATADPPHAIGQARPVCTREAFYWCTTNLQPKNALLRFGLRDRAFDVVPSPPGTDFHPSVDHVTELTGKLCYVHTATDTAFDVWVAAGGDDGPPEWSLRCRVDFDLFGPAVGAEALLPVTVAGDDEMLIAADYRTLYSYDARRDSLVRVVDMEEELAYDTANGGEPYSGGLLHHVVPYVESLVPIGKQRMQKPG